MFLDTGPLGMLSNPAATKKTKELAEWMTAQLDKGVRFFIPEVSDYEVRRNAILENLTGCLQRLDELTTTITYVPLTTSAMREAARLWATVRGRGQPTAPKEELDCDAILAAQAITTSKDSEEVIIVTDNIGHLSRFETATVKAMNWRDIP